LIIHFITTSLIEAKTRYFVCAFFIPKSNVTHLKHSSFFSSFVEFVRFLLTEFSSSFSVVSVVSVAGGAVLFFSGSTSDMSIIPEFDLKVQKKTSDLVPNFCDRFENESPFGVYEIIEKKREKKEKLDTSKLLCFLCGLCVCVCV
jgi:hypothetical protein